MFFLIWTPGPASAGTYENVTLGVSDGINTVTRSFTLIVTPVIYSMFDDIGSLRVVSWVRFPRRLRRRGWVPGGEKVPGTV